MMPTLLAAIMALSAQAAAADAQPDRTGPDGSDIIVEQQASSEIEAQAKVRVPDIAPRSAAAASEMPAIRQIPMGDGQAPVAQVSSGDTEIVTEAVAGEDFCQLEDRTAEQRQYCAGRIETRSAEFATEPRNRLSAEQRLLGEALPLTYRRTIESATRDLAANAGTADDIETQAIAAIALGSATSAPAPQPEDDPGKLGAETEALIEAIVDNAAGPGRQP